MSIAREATSKEMALIIASLNYMAAWGDYASEFPKTDPYASSALDIPHESDFRELAALLKNSTVRLYYDE